MVNGYAIGGGHVLHLQCDLSIAAETAKFGQTGPKVGSFDAGYGAGYLANVVGQKKAREIWYLCRQYSPPRRRRWVWSTRSFLRGARGRKCVSWAREMLAVLADGAAFLKASFNAATDGLAGIQQLAGDATLLFTPPDEAEGRPRRSKEKWRPTFTSST